MNTRLRQEKLEDIKNQNKTIILYEAPHRIIKSLNDLKIVFGDIDIVIGKELTKIHEQFIRGNISTILQDLHNPKGEYIIMFEMMAKTNKEMEVDMLNCLPMQEQYDYYYNKGLTKKDIIKTIAKNNKVSKDEIYKKFI